MGVNNYRMRNRILAALFMVACFLVQGMAWGAQSGCRYSTKLAYTACNFGAKDDYFTDRAKCLDTIDADLHECFAEANDALKDSKEECRDVRSARVDVCRLLDNEVHEPEFGEEFADNFIDPLQIGSTVTPNPYFPLTPGNQWVLSGTFFEDGEEVTEVITIDVTSKTKLIDGITCVVVRDVVTIDDELVEDTDDWFAQDIDGNVWYCGEEVKDYETFEGDEPPLPELVSNDGSFKVGIDHQKGGILLPAVPVVGDIFRQELVWSDAEDIIEILSTEGSETVVATSCTGTCLVTRDFSPLDPGVEENKYYAPGIGKILEIDLESNTRFELIDYTVQ